MWSLHDDELPPGTVDRLDSGPAPTGDVFDASWVLEELLDVHAGRGEVEPDDLHDLVQELDLAHEGFRRGEPTAAGHVRDVISRIEALVDEGRLPASEADELIALAYAAIDMSEDRQAHYE